MTAQAIGIFASIIKWSESLQPWEREAVRRLVVNGSLGKTDEDDIIKLIKEPPTTEIITPEIPDPQPSVAESVHLVSLKHMKGVNALAPGCTLTYGGPVGLTVIYGDNGSGKSGYARILKKACRSRHPEPPILPNVFGSKSSAQAAEAEFVYMAGGSAITEPWIEGTSSSEELASIAVFDSKSARLYVEKEGELAYRPYGLEVFDQLGEFYRSAKRRLLEEAASIQVPKCITVFDHTKVRDAVAAVLGDNSEKNQKAINALGTVNDDEKTEAAQLQAQILQLEKEDPKKLAASRRAIADKLLGTAQRITTAHSKIQNNAKLLRESMEKAASESYLAKQASLIAFSKEPISGVGSDQWKAMFEDARAFSMEVAYPGQTFPVVGENSRCLLCHQILDNDAKDRLSRFADYIGNRAEERARQATKTYEQLRKEIVEAVKGVAGLDDALIDQVSEWNDAVGQAIKATRKAFSIWLTSAEAVSSSEQWTMLAVPAADTNAMAALAERLKAEADGLEKNAKPEALLKLKDRQSLLNDQISLSKALPTIIEIAGCEAKKRWLQKLSNAISTSHISRQATATTEQVLTKALCDALNTELEALDATSLKVEFAKKGDVGSVLHYLKLSNAPKGTKIEDVLSEGEHRCLAIAAFLAELVQLGHASAVVFDDPVSSLDHKRRDKVAARLVEEARRRQVVIFSHDLAFIYALDQVAAQTQTPMRTHAVKRTTAGTGDPVDGLYPEAMGLQAFISHIRLQATELSHLDELDAGRRAKVVDCYDLIRAAWERVVEASLLRSVVSPFDKAVHTQKLKSVLVEDTDYQTVYWAMKKASDIVEAHRTAPAGGTTNIPRNGQLLADIEALETFRRNTDKRAKEVEARRKKLESPPSC